MEQSIYDNILYGKLSFHIPLPPTYYRKKWDSKKANIEKTQRVISIFKWELTFQNKYINEKTKILIGL